jgi:hypothetical protein
LSYLGYGKMIFMRWCFMNEIQFIHAHHLSKNGNIRLDILDSSYVVGQRTLVVFIGKRKKGSLFL